MDWLIIIIIIGFVIIGGAVEKISNKLDDIESKLDDVWGTVDDKLGDNDFDDENN
jgi:tetrahydromethanopterin S-methyltransferase subunit G